MKYSLAYFYPFPAKPGLEKDEIMVGMLHFGAYKAWFGTSINKNNQTYYVSKSLKCKQLA